MPTSVGNRRSVVRLPRRFLRRCVYAPMPCQHPACNFPNAPRCEPPTAPEPIEMGLWVKPCPPPWAITPALCDCRGVSYAGGFMPQCLVSTQPAISQTRPNCEPPTEVGIISPSGRFQSARGRRPVSTIARGRPVVARSVVAALLPLCPELAILMACFLLLHVAAYPVEVWATEAESPVAALPSEP